MATAKLKLFLEKLGEGGDISTFSDGIATWAAIERERPDLLFLDIQMPGMTGMQVLARISDLPVIVTSAYDQYAIDSFSLNVTDYLLKPYTLERLQKAIEKARKAIRLREFEQSAQVRQITLRIEGRDETLKQDDILYLIALKDYVRVVTANGQQRLTLSTLATIEGMLDNDLFVRVHRSYLINRRHIASIGARTLTMADGTEIPIGRTYKDTLRITD